MTRKRNRLEIIKDILEVIKSKNGKIRPTHILYKSNLSYSMMEDYMGELIKKGFIEERVAGKNKTYIITIKGINFLRQYNLIADFTSSFGLD